MAYGMIYFFLFFLFFPFHLKLYIDNLSRNTKTTSPGNPKPEITRYLQNQSSAKKRQSSYGIRTAKQTSPEQTS